MKQETKVPFHLAIILDGNGRWATSRGKNRSYGHKMGAKNLKKLIKFVFKKGIKVFSIYAFSTENFKRSKEEVDYLMNLFLNEFEQIQKNLEKEKIKVIFSGRKEPLPEDVYQKMKKIENETKIYEKGIINVCVNYGGRTEIIDAVKDIIDHKIASDIISEEILEQHLYHHLPPIDLMIRTSGEQRISNFMLWQLSYAEFYFTDVHFPDFNEVELDKAIESYQQRDRRFGGIKYDNKNH